MRPRLLGVHLAVILAFGSAGEAAAQSDASWKDRGGPPAAMREAEHEEKVEAEKAREPKTSTATAEERGSFGKLVDFFFGDENGPKRSWGFVPLVVAESNAGFGGGIQFVENDLFDTRIGLEIFGIYTSNEFFEGQIRLTGPPIYAVDWRTFTRYRNRPRLFFYGIGNDTKSRDKMSLALEDTFVELRAGLVITRNLFFFGIGEFSNVNAKDGLHEPSEAPPVSSRFDSQTLVGFRDHAYTNGLGAALVLDFRDDVVDPSKGARLELRATYHGPEIGDSPYRFGFYTADAAVYIPIYEPWKLLFAVGARYETVDASLDSVPFYALPQLGGTRSLRGYFEGRFRDRNSVLFQGEVRFPIWRMIRGAVFVDAGRVYSDFTKPPSPFFEDFHIDVGAGIRLVIQPDIFTRLDFAISGEEFTFALEFGNAF